MSLLVDNQSLYEPLLPKGTPTSDETQPAEKRIRQVSTPALVQLGIMERWNAHVANWEKSKGNRGES